MRVGFGNVSHKHGAAKVTPIRASKVPQVAHIRKSKKLKYSSRGDEQINICM